MASQPIGQQQSIRFGDDFELDVRTRRLRRGSHVLKLERIPLEILVLLLEHQGEIVSRDEIVAKVWGNSVFFDTDNSIRGAIRKVRQVLKDDPENPRFIQTVTGQGYRFIAPIIVPGQQNRAVASRAEPPTGAETAPSFISELDGWLQSRKLRIEEEDTGRKAEIPSGCGKRPRTLDSGCLALDCSRRSSFTRPACRRIRYDPASRSECCWSQNQISSRIAFEKPLWRPNSGVPR